MENVARVLTHRMVATKVEVVESRLNQEQAHYTRDSLAKVRDCILSLAIARFEGFMINNPMT